MSLDIIVQQLIREGRLSLKQLATLLGVSENYLYKMSMPEWNDNHANIPLRKMIAIAKHQKSKKLAKYIAKEFNGIFVTLPRAARERQDFNKIVNEYSRLTNKTVQALMDFFQEPSQENHEDVLKKLRRVMEKSEGIRRRVKKDGFQQMELFED